MEKNRKTGFKCPRGSGKGTKFNDPCPGRITKSHPIHPRNEDNKKRRQDLPEGGDPKPPKVPLPVNGKAPAGKGKVEEVKKPDAVVKKDADKAKGAPLLALQLPKAGNAAVGKAPVLVQPKPPAPAPPASFTKEKLAELKAQARREIGLRDTGAIVAGPSSASGLVSKENPLAPLLAAKPANGTTSGNVWSRPGPSNVVPAEPVTKPKQTQPQKPQVEPPVAKVPVEAQQPSGSGVQQALTSKPTPHEAQPPAPVSVPKPTTETVVEEEEPVVPKAATKAGKKAPAATVSPSDAAAPDQDSIATSDTFVSREDQCIKLLVTRKALQQVQQIQRIGFAHAPSAAAIQKHGTDLLSAVSWLLEGGHEDCQQFQTGDSVEVDISDELTQVYQLQGCHGMSVDNVYQAVIDCGGDVGEATQLLAKRVPSLLSSPRFPADCLPTPTGGNSSMHSDPIVSPPPSCSSTSSAVTFAPWLAGGQQEHAKPMPMPTNGQRSQSRLLSWLGASSSVVPGKPAFDGSTGHKNGVHLAKNYAGSEDRHWKSPDENIPFVSNGEDYTAHKFSLFSGVTSQRFLNQQSGVRQPWDTSYQPVSYTGQGQDVPEAALYAAAAVTSEPDHPSTAEDTDLSAVIATLMRR